MSDQDSARGRSAGPRGAFAIERSRIDDWVSTLLARGWVVAPTAGHGGDVLYAPVETPDQVRWEFDNSLHPPKEVLLPQTDPLFEIRGERTGWQLEALPPGKPRILLNARSCDVSGMRFLRRVHESDLPDSAYLRRDADLTVVSLSCPQPCPQGFCICCDAGPFLDDGFDVQLTDLGELMLAEVGSAKGEALVRTGNGLFRPATEQELSRRRMLEAVAIDSFGESTCHFASAMRRISTGRVVEALWDTMSDWCFECGACTLVCPTCYCFSIKDRQSGGGWQRCRMWDSCQYGAFTLEASGHNPRPHRKDRVKRRFYHKVSAQYHVRDGTVGCVGCGRCVTVCLGTTDMPAVVAAIRKGVWNG